MGNAEFLDEFRKETDRAAAVLGAAYLESRLEELLRAKFVAVPKFVEDLLTGQGGLSSFSSKISVAYAIGLISLHAAQDLHLVRRIRNKFAHHIHGISFETPNIVSRVDNFHVLKALRNEQGEAIPQGTDRRKKFNVAVSILLLTAIESRIRDMPKFQEATGVATITLSEF